MYPIKCLEFPSSFPHVQPGTQKYTTTTKANCRVMYNEGPRQSSCWIYTIR